MKNTFTFFSTGLLALGLLFSQCSKDDNNKKANSDYTAPSVAGSAAVTVPEQLEQASDPMAQMAYGYVQLCNGVSTWVSHFDVPDNATVVPTKSLGTKTYTWSYGGYSEWVEFTETLTQYEWEVSYQTPVVSKFKLIDAVENKVTHEGSMNIYDPENSGHPSIWTYAWEPTVDGRFASLTYVNPTEGEQRFEVTANTDNTGKFEYFEASVKRLIINWNANGSGDWWFLTEDDVELTGSWTAK